MRAGFIVSIALATALSIVGTYAFDHTADAQSGPPAAVSDPPPAGPNGGPGGGRPGWGMQRGMWGQPGMWAARRRMAMMRRNDFGLFAWVPDKQLTTADVQTIAQAMLLRHGNHTWKVGDVVANQDNTISFAFTTSDGGVVARFAMDTRTGRLRRTG